jgi:uncharacterized protein with PIN domain
MKLSTLQLAELIKVVALTRPDEVSCERCLQDLAEFSESTLAGKTVGESLQVIESHLAICAECREEYEALLRALEDTE